MLQGLLIVKLLMFFFSSLFLLYKVQMVFEAEHLSGLLYNITFPKKTNCLIFFGKAKGRRRMASVPPFASIL